MTRGESMCLPHLFSSDGEAALATVMRCRPLLAFDFDGTLAPIVSQPELARVPLAVSRKLCSVREHLPVAIITGRAVADVRARIDFEADYVVGNHGAELEPLGTAAGSCEGLDLIRERIDRRRGLLAVAGVSVEDKELSLALHYRLAPDPTLALALITALLKMNRADVRVFGGKSVVNIVPAHAPDKAQALFALMDRCGRSAAVFVGDDENDEPVFAAAPTDWLTVRVGRERPGSRAGWFLDSVAEMALLLDRILQHSRYIEGKELGLRARSAL